MKEKERSIKWVWKRLLAIVLTAALLPIGALQGAWADTATGKLIAFLGTGNIGDNDYLYTGEEICPFVTVRNEAGSLLTNRKDYEVSYKNNTEVGTATVEIKGIGDYSGESTSKTFSIKKLSIDSCKAVFMRSFTDKLDLTYTGSPLYPSVLVYVEGYEEALRESGDYDLAYKNNTAVGTATVTITGKRGCYGTKTLTFNIVSGNTSKDLSGATVSNISDQTYTGKAIEPEVTVTMGGQTLVKNKDYKVNYSNNTNVGTATVEIRGTGTYTGSKKVSFNIVSYDLTYATIDPIPEQNYISYYNGYNGYNGYSSAICPTVTVRLGNKTLTRGVDYDVTYSNNTYIGTASVTITGKGSYTGSRSTTFKIVTPSITNATVVSITDQTYTGSPLYPSLTIYSDGYGLLQEGRDYTVSYQNNINIGTGYVIVTGCGSYSGSRQVTFRIVAPSISSSTITAIPDQLYTGNAITPLPTVSLNGVMLTQYTDYVVSYSNNRNVGTATMTITGRGNYTGSRTTTFRILAKNLGNATVSSIATQKYTGKSITPSVTVKIGDTVLSQYTDYTLTYNNNREPGTASITITGTGTCSGTKTVTFKIAQPNISAATVKVADQTYTGYEKTPAVTVKLNGVTLEEDEDYEIEYRNNVSVGKATVVIYGAGDYDGTKKATFVIKPAKMKWTSAKANGNSAVLKWKKQSRVDGYEVYRSKSKSSGYKRLGTLDQDVSSCTNPRLSKGTYYFKIRSYVEIDGKKYYGAYSAVKKVTIK